MNRRVLTLIVLLAWSAAPALAEDRIVLPADVMPEHYDIAVVPDASHLTFAGHVAIDVTVAKPTNTIKLNAADLSFGKVALTGESAAPKVSYDATQETATLTFAQPVAAGHHELTIDYTGKINQHAAGLFALDYDVAGGKKRALFTQFENSDARRFIPCWDEPARKATFTLTATVSAHEMAVSNMPVAKTERVQDSLARVHFATSPKMSSYLLFFGVGDFQRISKKVDGVDVGVVFKRGDADKAGYALDAAAHILPYYENYFGVKYPLPKLDLIAGPGQSQFFGAMENWGAIFYFERDLLIDPRISTQQDRRGVYITVAHEMAHQWFGDLVTMEWWDGIWLNEGFASWMELKATDHFHPEWKVWLDALNSKEGAMQIDARAGTHPIITPIHDVLQANEAFDTITYQKGQAVIRMLETYMGEDRFRAGVQAYIKAHEYGNTVTDDLWRELDKTAATADLAHRARISRCRRAYRSSAPAPTGSGIHLAQDRFAADDSAKAPTSWPVPVVVSPVTGIFLGRSTTRAGSALSRATSPQMWPCMQTQHRSSTRDRLLISGRSMTRRCSPNSIHRSRNSRRPISWESSSTPAHWAIPATCRSPISSCWRARPRRNSSRSFRARWPSGSRASATSMKAFPPRRHSMSTPGVFSNRFSRRSAGRPSPANRKTFRFCVPICLRL